MNARCLATTLALTSLVAAGPLDADTPRPEVRQREVRAELPLASFAGALLSRVDGWLETWMFATELPPVPDPDERPTEGPQSDPNG